MAEALAFSKACGVSRSQLSGGVTTPVCHSSKAMASAHVQPAAVAEVVAVSSDLGQHAAWIQEYVDLGFEEIYLHHVGVEQRGFLDAFGEHVLPQVGVTAPEAAVAL